MLAPFLGFGPRAFEWFRALEADNSKAYFERERAVWETKARAPLERLLEELAEELGGAARLFRPHRDVRFSKNEAPYKTSNYGVVRVPGTESGSMSRSRRAACTRAAATGRWRRTSSPAIARP